MATATNINTGPRRSATLPTTLQRTGGETADVDPQAETLFVHPSAKIVSFSAPTATGAIGSPKDVGTLPWKRSNERVVAVGSLRIYRVPGSVSFIESGDLLLSLLPRSQCWCVDGESKFAMSLKGMIYRIELPFNTEEDKTMVEEMKEALGKIIKYEKTPCPFRRGFTVDGVDEPDSPIPLGPKWSHIKDRQRKAAETVSADVGEIGSGSAREGSSPEISDEDGSMSTVTEETVFPHRTTVAGLQENDTKPPIRPRVADTIRSFSTPLQPIISNDGGFDESMTEHEKENLERSSNARNDNITSDQMHTTPTSRATMSSPSPPSTEEQPSPLQNARVRPPANADNSADDPFTDGDIGTPDAVQSTTPLEPTQETKGSLTSEEITSQNMEDGDAAGEEIEELPQGSTYTEITTESDLPSTPVRSIDFERDRLPAPPSSTPPMVASPIRAASSELSTAPAGATFTTDASHGYDRRRTSLESLTDEPQTPPRRKRSSVLTSPPEHNLPVGIISRTAAILMGPPSGLIQIMMQIASRIAGGTGAAGAYRFRLAPGPGTGKRIHLGRRYSNLPGRWEDSEDDDAESESSKTASEDKSVDEDDWSDEFEDDYGVALTNDEAGRARRRKWSASDQKNEDFGVD